MRNGFLGSVAGLLVAAGLVVGQGVPGPRPATAEEESAPATAPTAPSGEEQALLPAPAPAPKEDFSLPVPRPAKSEDPLLPTPRSVEGTGTLPPRVGVPDESVSSFRKGLGEASMGNPLAPPQLTGGVEYLLWWIKQGPDLPSVVNGLNLNEAGDASLRGGDGAGLNYNLMSGGRFSLGYAWETCGGCYAVDANLFFLARQSLSYRADSDVLLGRPYSDIIRGEETFLPLTLAGAATGTFRATSAASLWGTEANGYLNIINDPVVTSVRLDLLAGLRYLELSEDLNFTSITAFNRNLANFPDILGFAGNRIQVADNFLTRNRFLGAQGGLALKFFLDYASIEFRTKLAVGTTYEEVSIQGNQLRTFANGTTSISQGGLFALASNIGRFHREQFSLVPELDINVEIPLTSHFRFKSGYTGFFWNRVARPGTNIDRHIDVNQLPNFGSSPTNQTTFARPTLPFQQSTFYADGFTFGLEFLW